MNRFYVPPDRISEDRIEFTPEQRKQLRSVLRLTPTDRVSVFDGSGREYATEIVVLDDKQAVGKIVTTANPSTEADIRMTLIQGIPKGEKTDLILQKCTEIGVAEFLFMETERAVPRISSDKMPARLERWRSITREAAEQSWRVILPSVDGVVSFQEAIQRATSYNKAFIASPYTTTPFNVQSYALGVGSSIALLIGPEGGFTEKEIEAAKSAGITPISLGPRILRTETAAIVASALTIYG